MTKSVDAKEKARDAIRQAMIDKNAELAAEDDNGEEIELRKKQFGKAP